MDRPMHHSENCAYCKRFDKKLFDKLVDSIAHSTPAKVARSSNRTNTGCSGARNASGTEKTFFFSGFFPSHAKQSFKDSLLPKAVPIG